MLRSFHYYEPEEENRIRKEMKDSALFEREIETAGKFAKAQKQCGGRRQAADVCPICRSRNIAPFYEKWGVQYFRCDICYSVFADVDTETEEKYRCFPELVQIRTSAEYQEKAAYSRRQMWNELLDWLKFRTYRYLGKNTGLRILDYGNRYQGLIDLIQKSDLCGSYELRNSILPAQQNHVEKNTAPADVVLCLDDIQHETDPVSFLKEVKQSLSPEGLLFLSTRVGGGFDILTLRENNRNVFPYEHIMMPSKEGIRILLEAAGYEMLEITTPGTFDWNYVKANKKGLSEGEYFLRYFMDTATTGMEAEFQRFLQQSGLSSYAQVVAGPVASSAPGEGAHRGLL